MPYLNGRYPRSAAIGATLIALNDAGLIGDALGTALAALEDLASDKILDPNEFAHQTLLDIERKLGIIDA